MTFEQSLPRPYYADSSVTIYRGDALDLLPQLGTFDAVVTDPPFGIQDAPILTQGRTGKRTGAVNNWHADSAWDASIDPRWCEAVCAAAPVVAWFGHWRKRGEVEAAMPHPLRAEIVWAKDTHVGPPCPLAMRDERIWLFSAVGLMGSRFETSVWDEPIIPTWAKRWHKNEKPLNLMTRLLTWLGVFSIVDPFCGSGTTLRAAKNVGMRAVGIDISEAHCSKAAERCRQEVLDLGGVA